MRNHFGTSWLIILTLTLTQIWVLPEVEAAAELSRVKRFLGKNCGLLADFLSPLCRPAISGPCCTLFSLVDICRTSCSGDFDLLTTQSLHNLLREQALCSQIKIGGMQLCEGSDSKRCKALKCFMNLVCFQGHTSCDEESTEIIIEVAAFTVHHQSRAFALPEQAACEATSLVEFRADNVQTCPPLDEIKSCENDLEYRTVDGHCNNLEFPDRGKFFTPVKRFLNPPAYQDGVNAPRSLGEFGQPLKSPRTISRTVCPEESDLTDLSVMVMAFGQFIDHDFTGFPVIQKNDTSIKCCVADLESTMKVENGGPCFPILIDNEEDFFRGRDCMEFTRSMAAMDDNGGFISPRIQINSLTSFIDASTVYGNNEEVNNLLRGEGGKLLVSKNNMLPPNNKSNCKIVDEKTDYCLLTGDHRVHVFVGLGVLHTLFHREHNRLVDELATVNPHWRADPEKLYQEARKINAALHQHITYAEYLPAILDDATLDGFRLRVGDYEYDPTIDPQVANSFSTAAFRFGHSQIQHFVQVGNDQIPMEETFSRPHLVLTRFNEVLEGLAFKPSENVDRHFVEAVTNRLFEQSTTSRDGLDLVSLNTQRGRDHGLPPYNDFRKFCGLDPVTDFNDPVFPEDNQLALVYDDVNDIDLFIGGVSEKHQPGSMVGPTFACIIGQQFHDFKFGDRFWYETPRYPEGFTPEQLKEIRSIKLSSVACANTDIKRIQRDLMYVPDSVNNPLVTCDKMPQIDLSKWSEA